MSRPVRRLVTVLALATLAVSGAAAFAPSTATATATSAATADADPTISTIAGSVCSPSRATDIGIEPAAVASDGSGGFYVADNTHSVVCHVDADGAVSVAAGNGSAGYSADGVRATSTRLYTPSGLAVDRSGNLYIADRWNHRIRRVDARTGTVTTVAGTGLAGFAGDGGPATSARLNFPIGVAVDRHGNLFVGDSKNARVRRVDAVSGTITTVAGTGTAGFGGDGGRATSALLGFPAGIAVSGSSVYVADASNDRVRRIDLRTGSIATVAGSGTRSGDGDGGRATSAGLHFPLGVAADGATLYIADSGNHRVRVVRSGRISTVIGSGAAGFAGDGGRASTAQLRFPVAVAVDAGGDLLVADQGNRRVRQFDAATQVVTTAAGNGTQGFSGDGGPADAALLNQPTALAWAGESLLIADGHNNVVRRVGPDGSIEVIAGTPGVNGAAGDGGPAGAATLGFVSGVAVDGHGNLFIADWGHRIRKVSVDGRITTVAGTGVAGFGGDGGPASRATLSRPSSLVFDRWNNLYLTDTGNHRIRRISAVAGQVGPSSPITTVGGTGVPTFSGDGGPARSAALSEPMGLAFDAAGALFVADTHNQRIRRIGPDGVISTVAGNGAPAFSPDGTPVARAALNHPRAVAFTAEGDLLVAETGNCLVRRVVAFGTAEATIATVAGWTPIRGVTPVCDYAGEGVHPTRGGAMLFNPSALAVGLDGSIVVADSLNHRVRRIG